MYHTKEAKSQSQTLCVFCVFSWLLDFFKTLDSQTHRENQIYFEVKVGPKKLIIDLSTGSRDYEKAIEQMKSLGFLPLGVSPPCTHSASHFQLKFDLLTSVTVLTSFYIAANADAVIRHLKGPLLHWMVVASHSYCSPNLFSFMFWTLHEAVYWISKRSMMAPVAQCLKPVAQCLKGLHRRQRGVPGAENGASTSRY